MGNNVVTKTISQEVIFGLISSKLLSFNTSKGRRLETKVLRGQDGLVMQCVRFDSRSVCLSVYQSTAVPLPC